MSSFIFVRCPHCEKATFTKLEIRVKIDTIIGTYTKKIEHSFKCRHCSKGIDLTVEVFVPVIATAESGGEIK